MRRAERKGRRGVSSEHHFKKKSFTPNPLSLPLPRVKGTLRNTGILRRRWRVLHLLLVALYEPPLREFPNHHVIRLSARIYLRDQRWCFSRAEIVLRICSKEQREVAGKNGGSFTS